MKRRDKTWFWVAMLWIGISVLSLCISVISYTEPNGVKTTYAV